MVELRSGRRVELGCVKEAKPRGQYAKHRNRPRSLVDITQTGREMTPGFDIYEDDPDAERPDLDTEPLECWEIEVTNDENIELPVCMPTQGRRITTTSTTLAASVRNGRLPPITADSSRRGSVPLTSSRRALHQLPQNDDDNDYAAPVAKNARLSQNSSKPAGGSVHKGLPSRMTSKQPLQITPRQTRAEVRGVDSTQSSIKRINVMDLR